MSDLLSVPNKVVMDSIIKNVILTLEKLDAEYFNSPKQKALYYPKSAYSRTITTLFGEVTFKRRAYVDKNGKNNFYYLDSLLNISPRVVFDNDVINELLFFAEKHTSYSTIGQILGQYIFKNDFSIDKSKYISRCKWYVNTYKKATEPQFSCFSWSRVNIIVQFTYLRSITYLFLLSINSKSYTSIPLPAYIILKI